MALCGSGDERCNVKPVTLRGKQCKNLSNVQADDEEALREEEEEALAIQRKAAEELRGSG